jgi:hypothetical protein
MKPNEKEKTLDPKGEELKRKHGAKAVYKLEIEGDDAQKFVGWIRKPNLDEIGAFVSLSQSNPVKGAQVLLNSTWLEGDELIKTEEELFLGVMSVLNNIIKVRVAKVSKY